MSDVILESVFQPGFDVTYIYHHFYLRATNCPKGTTDSTGCQFRNDRVSFCLLLLSFLAECPCYAAFQRPGPALTCTALFVCIHAAADRLCRLLQNTEEWNWTSAQTLCTLHPQNNPDTGRTIYKVTLTFGKPFHKFDYQPLRLIQTNLQFIFTFFSHWMSGNEGGQSRALQPHGLQQWSSNASSINRK